MAALVLALFFALFLVLFAVLRRENTRGHSEIFPGPRGLPFLGSVLELAPETPWKTYKRWAERYGPLFTFNIFGRTILVVNSLSACRELLEKRPQTYSDRADIAMLREMGWDFNLAFIRYHDERFQKYRRAIVRGVGLSASASLKPIIIERCDALLLQLFKAPSGFEMHLKDYSISILLQHLFGFQDYLKHRSFVYDTVLPTVEQMSEKTFFGAQILFAFPMLKHLPHWFPGIGFLKVAREQLRLVEKLLREPVDQVKDQRLKGSKTPSWTLDLLEDSERSSDAADSISEHGIREITATVLTAASTTVSSALQTIFLAMILNPDVQKRAQEEIDSVTGGGRLPDFSDAQNLPYVTAICKEVLRWNLPVPIAAHNTTSTDSYMEYTIPKDTTIVMNMWAMSRDSALFKDPESFIPDRFLAKGTAQGRESDSLVSLAWGFGRRSCPGRNLGETMLWLATARILAVYNIGKKVTPDGDEVNVQANFITYGIFSHPTSFPCSITPRSHETQMLISELS